MWDLKSRHDECVEVFSEHFNEFCIKLWIKTHVIDVFSLSFLGSADTKVSYLVVKRSFTGINLQTLIEVWSKKSVTYYILKIVKSSSVV